MALATTATKPSTAKGRATGASTRVSVGSWTARTTPMRSSQTRVWSPKYVHGEEAWVSTMFATNDNEPTATAACVMRRRIAPSSRAASAPQTRRITPGQRK